MLRLWDAVEADFYRDYRIDLTVQLDQMTWRRFQALLNNLNPDGAVAARIRYLKDHPDTDGAEDEESDKTAADRFFARMLSLS